ncbi:MAG: hypothetical protein JW755_14325 [Candidatus Aminicenantes bacterium]|nr:hypothetical protein [Candidatus Aminicenantes bacterium]
MSCRITSLRLLLRQAFLLMLIFVTSANNTNGYTGCFSQESQILKEEQEQFLPKSGEVQGWRSPEPVSHYNRESLYGYINGGAEIFLQYDFRHLTHAVYSRDIQGAAPEIIIEIYTMAAPLDAFGIFSVNRSGGEQVSQKINALNWISPSQINFVKESYYVNILGFECGLEELEDFTSIVANNIPGKSAVPPVLNRFPDENRIQGSEKYIKGPLAAVGESVLLQAEFWGFNHTTYAYSCRYQPHNSRAILLQFQMIPDTIGHEVEALFTEFLEKVETAGSEIKGQNAVGRYFIFNCSEQEAGLVLGEESLESARFRMDKLLGGLNNNPNRGKNP